MHIMIVKNRMLSFYLWTLYFIERRHVTEEKAN